MVVSDSERTHEAKATDINLQKTLFIRFMYVSLALVVLPSAMTIFYFSISKQATASISTPAFC